MKNEHGPETEERETIIQLPNDQKPGLKSGWVSARYPFLELVNISPVWLPLSIY